MAERISFRFGVSSVACHQPIGGLGASGAVGDRVNGLAEIFRSIAVSCCQRFGEATNTTDVNFGIID